MKTSRPALLVLFAALILVLAACQQAALGPVTEVPAPDFGGGVTGRDVDGAGAPLVPGDEGLDSSGEPGAVETDRSIIRTGEITVEVDDVAEITGQVRALALELDGFISSSFQGEFEDSATLTMRIPADRFDEAIEAVHDLGGEVKAEATREEDVTAVVIDLEARLENLRAAEAQYRELLDRATDIEDILAIQNQLFQVRGEIESMQAQLAYYTDQVELATLTVTVVPVPEPVEQVSEDFDPAAIVQEALASLVSLGQSLVEFGIWFVIVGVPALIIIGLIVFVAIRLIRRTNSGRSTPPPAEAEPPATA
ncbi:MAG TPA: DUF4349 domain-containing protein [Candidatus Limnocylindria bacterium]